jgi:hypothetical protein
LDSTWLDDIRASELDAARRLASSKTHKMEQNQGRIQRRCCFKDGEDLVNIQIAIVNSKIFDFFFFLPVNFALIALKKLLGRACC